MLMLIKVKVGYWHLTTMKEGPAITEVDGVGVMAGLDAKPSEAAVDATGDVVVVVGCPKFAVSWRGGMTGGK